MYKVTFEANGVKITEKISYDINLEFKLNNTVQALDTAQKIAAKRGWKLIRIDEIKE